MRTLLNIFVWLFLVLSVPGFTGMIYQDFEDNNGTPHKDNLKSLPVEYGWGFNGAVVQRSANGASVHSGAYSWAVTVPQGPKVHAGTAVLSQIQTLSLNFIRPCHDRLSFWIWSNPSKMGDHTVMVKFFDQGLYKDHGVGIWTKENQRAKYREWTKLEIYFNDLPMDFDLEHVQKIEFFNYWDGTYFYDDIQLASANSPQQDATCLSDHKFVICQSNEETATQPTCVSVFEEKGEFAIDLLKMKATTVISAQ